MTELPPDGRADPGALPGLCLLAECRSPAARLHIGALRLVRGILAPFRYRGLGVYCRQAGRLFGAAAPMVEVRLSTGGRFAMPVYDLAWQAYLYRGRAYEPEIALFLHKARDMSFDWVDCGANYGYWPAWLAGLRRNGEKAAEGAGRIIAVEPSPACLPVLRRTVALNAPAITLVEKALHRDAGAMIPFLVSDVHVASHALEEGEAPAGGDVVHVPATSLDALAAEFGLGGRPLIAKLDVEGQEVDTIAGAGRLADADILYLYEDHGKDPDCRPSAHLLDAGFSVFALAGDGQRPMASVAEIAAFKTRPARGYNFAATRSGPWLDLLRRT